MQLEEYTYWTETKRQYEYNLKNNIGHAESIRTLIDKIDTKLSSYGFTEPSRSSAVRHP